MFAGIRTNPELDSSWIFCKKNTTIQKTLKRAFPVFRAFQSFRVWMVSRESTTTASICPGFASTLSLLVKEVTTRYTSIAMSQDQDSPLSLSQRILCSLFLAILCLIHHLNFWYIGFIHFHHKPQRTRKLALPSSFLISLSMEKSPLTTPPPLDVCFTIVTMLTIAEKAFENTSTSVAASQMRNALNNLADTVSDPEQKKVSVISSGRQAPANIF